MNPIKESAFLTPLEVSPASEFDDGLWLLTQPLIYQSVAAQKVITVPTGFKTDFASVPRIPGVYDAVGGIANEAAVVHDFLYTSHITTREVADAVLREASAVTHVALWRRWIMWAGVRVFGGSHW